jgi:hypothetical protein
MLGGSSGLGAVGSEAGGRVAAARQNTGKARRLRIMSQEMDLDIVVSLRLKNESD